LMLSGHWTSKGCCFQVLSDLMLWSGQQLHYLFIELSQQWMNTQRDLIHLLLFASRDNHVVGEYVEP
jgi:hypothetical protein